MPAGGGGYGYDRFIRRSGGLLPLPTKKRSFEAVNPLGDAYVEALAEALLDHDDKDNPCFCSSGSPCCRRPKKRARAPVPPPQKPNPERVLSAQELADDDCVNLLDWGSRGDLAVALGNRVILWNGRSRSMEPLDMGEPVTSISWAPDGRRIAVALDSYQVHIMDAASGRRLTTLATGAEVESLSWKDDHEFAAGQSNGSIFIYDVRAELVRGWRAHQSDVCGLKWSGRSTASRQQLASAGREGTVNIWDPAMWDPASAASPILHSFRAQPPVRALDWCPSKSNLLASGGGDGRIKLFDTATGAVRDSVNAGAPLCALLWSKDGSELLSSHCGLQDQLILWKFNYPSLLRVKALTAHPYRPLFLAQSPDGCRVASAGGEVVDLWRNLYRPKAAPAPAPTLPTLPRINTLMHIRYNAIYKELVFPMPSKEGWKKTRLPFKM